MKRISVIGLLLPLFVFGQRDLTGTWRLKESIVFKGADYAGAIPLLITIEQKKEVIFFESIWNNGMKDTVVKESLFFGEKALNESLTKTGMKRIYFAQKKGDNNAWLKQTEVFVKEDSSKRQSINKESFTLFPNGLKLSLFKEYDGNQDYGGNENFVIEGIYEKVGSEQLTSVNAIGKGANFVEGLSWEQILTKARAENKYVFVDCYATWCRPCKMMDKYVYPLSMVGEILNNQFVSVKVQMDSTKNDPSQIKMLYPLARKLEKDYKVEALPTYLFFSPNGEAIHKAIGQKDAQKFLELLSKAKDPNYQLYTLFRKAKNRELSYVDYPALAKRVKEEFNEKEMALEIAGIYNRGYLNKLNEKELLKKSNLDFVGSYADMVSSSDLVFQLCLKFPKLVDSIKESKSGRWADALVNRTIVREDVRPFFLKAENLSKEPDWAKLQQKLTKKYNNEMAITYVLDARIDWYEQKKDWISFLQYLKQHLARHDLKNMNVFHLNTCAWKVFKHSDDTVLMKEAIEWIDIAIDKTPKDILWMTTDTKACLLYKMGKKDEGIAMMKRILGTYPEHREVFQSRLDSMLKGDNIWLAFN